MLIAKLEFISYFIHQPSTNVSFHKHNCYEIVYYLNGSGITTISDHSYKYGPNTFSIVCPHNYHTEIHHELTNVIFIGFTYDKSLVQLENGIYQDPSSLFFNIIDEMKREMAEKNSYYNIKLDLLINDFVIKFIRNKSSGSSNYSCYGLEYIKKFINENLYHHISVEKLSEISGYSYHHFRHLFKNKVGCSPIKYIINKRIEHAKLLLTTTDKTISSIAEESGFPNSSQFSFTFKKYTGKTPKEYRRINQL